MAEQRSLTVSDLGELALIERLKPFCAPQVVGDDGALMAVDAGHRLVVTTDMLVDTVHFSDHTTPPFTVGWRAVAANLSDLAAMGATPLGITVGLGLPPETSWAWVKALYEGMAACLRQYGGAIVGGDVCRAAQRTVSITALGQVWPEWAIRRDTAVAGMSVVVTGTHGGSRAGLAILLGELDRCDSTAAGAWIRSHQQPIPRFDAIFELNQQMPLAGPRPAIAGMDSSDGLANALLQLSKSSGVGMDIVRSRIPLPPGLSAAVGPDLAVNWALYGGEDFELVLCLPPDLATSFAAASGAIILGKTTHTGTVQMLFWTADGKPTPMSIPLSHKSFQHF